MCTTGNSVFAMRGSGTAKATKDTAKPLPCVDARQSAHGNVTNGNVTNGNETLIYVGGDEYVE
jgi:hypothetical protein